MDIGNRHHGGIFADDTILYGLISDRMNLPAGVSLASWCQLDNLEFRGVKREETAVEFMRNPLLPPQYPERLPPPKMGTDQLLSDQRSQADDFKLNLLATMMVNFYTAITEVNPLLCREVEWLQSCVSPRMIFNFKPQGPGGEQVK